VAQEPVGVLSALGVVCEEHEDVVLIVLAGELDVYTAPGFQEDLRHYDPAEVQMVIDLAAVRFLDAAGLGALVRLRNQASRQAATLGLVCPSRWLLRLFSITGLRPVFAFGDDLAAVRAALSRRGATPVRSGCG
jgi:anti-sigma B factor antagonist